MKPLFYIDPKSIPIFTEDTFPNASTVYVTSTPDLDDCTLALYTQEQTGIYTAELKEKIVKLEKAIDIVMEQRDAFYNELTRIRENGNQP